MHSTYSRVAISTCSTVAASRSADGLLAHLALKGLRATTLTDLVAARRRWRQKSCSPHGKCHESKCHESVDDLIRRATGRSASGGARFERRTSTPAWRTLRTKSTIVSTCTTLAPTFGVHAGVHMPQLDDQLHDLRVLSSKSGYPRCDVELPPALAVPVTVDRWSRTGEVGSYRRPASQHLSGWSSVASRPITIGVSAAACVKQHIGGYSTPLAPWCGITSGASTFRRGHAASAPLSPIRPTAVR